MSMTEHHKMCYVFQNGGTCCPWMGYCDCQCMCDYIAEIEAPWIGRLEKEYDLGYDRGYREGYSNGVQDEKAHQRMEGYK